MDKWLIALLAGLTAISANAFAATGDAMAQPEIQIAQKDAGSMGPTASPGSNMARPRAFPSSSGAGVTDRDQVQSDEYTTAIQDCESLPHSQRATCVNETNRKFGQM